MVEWLIALLKKRSTSPRMTTYVRVNFNDGEVLNNGELIAVDNEGIVVQWDDGGAGITCVPWLDIRKLDIDEQTLLDQD
jgi:hypothetical protein